jgi:hypothetical protein
MSQELLALLALALLVMAAGLTAWLIPDLRKRLEARGRTGRLEDRATPADARVGPVDCSTNDYTNRASERVGQVDNKLAAIGCVIVLLLGVIAWELGPGRPQDPGLSDLQSQVNTTNRYLNDICDMLKANVTKSPLVGGWTLQCTDYLRTSR